jgi:hypothetical protein
VTEQWAQQLDLLIRAGTPLIWIRSHEEERVESLLHQAAERLPGRRLASWDFVSGLSGVLGSEGLGARQPMLVLQWLQDSGWQQSPRCFCSKMCIVFAMTQASRACCATSQACCGGVLIRSCSGVAAGRHHLI